MSYVPPDFDAVDFSGPAGDFEALDFAAVDFPLVAIVPEGEIYSVTLPLHVQVAARYSAAMGLLLSVSDARVFDSAIGRISWSLRVIIGGVDYSGRLCGVTSIEADEDSARLATLDLLLEAPAELTAMDSAPIAIDVIVAGGGYTASRRRFTGRVEIPAEFSPADRRVSLVCRDGYQERIKAAGSVAAVRSMLGDMVMLSDKLTAWDDAEPDPVGYFRAALDTVPGATFIDGAGQWRIVRWDLTGPARTYGAADMFDPGPILSQPARSDMPAAVVATLTHEFSRLHNVELALTWEGPAYEDFVIKGVLHTPKSIVLDALDGISDWQVRGNPVLVSPTPGEYPVWDGVQTVYYLVQYGSAEQQIDSMTANVYRRWYQIVSRRYTVTIDMGGSSDRDDSISRSIRSTFDAAGWESGKRAEPSLGIYRANPPIGAEDDEELTGYEALEAPWPPTNGAVDWPADIDNSTLQQAVEQVVAEATRKAAQGRRKRRITIERPVDLRLELGDVCAVDALGLAGVGQTQSFAERYDHDSGSCVGKYVFACPKGGGGSTTGYSLSLTVPTADDVAHALYGYPLGNHYGADTETPTDWVHPDSLAGYLCNTLPTSDHYVASKPTFEQQFRIILPEIPAAIRDPLEQVVAVDASVDLADGNLIIDF